MIGNGYVFSIYWLGHFKLYNSKLLLYYSTNLKYF